MSKTNFDEQSRNTGWIGLYREFWARLFSFLTIGLLPLATAILVSLESWEAFSISSAVAVMYTSPIVILVGLAGLLAAFLTFMLSRSEARHYIPDELGS